MEVQVGQIAKLLSGRPQGSLPGNTEANPKEQVKAITLRSEKQLDSDVDKLVPATMEKGNEGIIEEDGTSEVEGVI